MSTLLANMYNRPVVHIYTYLLPYHKTTKKKHTSVVKPEQRWPVLFPCKRTTTIHLYSHRKSLWNKPFWIPLRSSNTTANIPNSNTNTFSTKWIDGNSTHCSWLEAIRNSVMSSTTRQQDTRILQFSTVKSRMRQKSQNTPFLRKFWLIKRGFEVFTSIWDIKRYHPPGWAWIDRLIRICVATLRNYFSNYASETRIMGPKTPKIFHNRPQYRVYCYLVFFVAIPLYTVPQTRHTSGY